MCPHFEGPKDAITAIDLFAGLGGLTFGLSNTGIKVVRGYEKDDMARATYHTHHCQPNETSLHGDATNVDEDLKGKIDIVSGGPPCQDFSHNAGETEHDTERNKLPFTMVEWAKVNPKVVLMENVEGLKESHEMTVDQILDAFEDTGYQTKIITLNAIKFGVPQSRKRVFIIAVRNDINPPNQWKPPAICNEGQKSLTEFTHTFEPYEYTTTSEVLNDLPEPMEPSRPHENELHNSLAEAFRVENNGYTRARVDPQTVSGFIERGSEEIWMPPNHVKADHSYETKEKMSKRELGRNTQPTTSRRLDPDEPAPTMTVSNGTPPIHYIGRSPSNPEKSVEDVRRLTVREVARIQGFHDEYGIAGTKTEQFRQVANAVPPPMAKQLGRHIRREIIGAKYEDDVKVRSKVS